MVIKFSVKGVIYCCIVFVIIVIGMVIVLFMGIGVMNKKIFISEGMKKVNKVCMLMWFVVFKLDIFLICRNYKKSG